MRVGGQYGYQRPDRSVQPVLVCAGLHTILAAPLAQVKHELRKPLKVAPVLGSNLVA